MNLSHNVNTKYVHLPAVCAMSFTLTAGEQCEIVAVVRYVGVGDILRRR